jgi:hypothetical protein
MGKEAQMAINNTFVIIPRHYLIRYKNFSFDIVLTTSISAIKKSHREKRKRKILRILIIKFLKLSHLESQKTILKIKAKRSRKMKENERYAIWHMTHEDQHAIYLIKRKSNTVKVKTQNSKAVY